MLGATISVCLGDQLSDIVAEVPLSQDYLNSPGLSKANQEVVLSAWARALEREDLMFHQANQHAEGAQRFEIATEEGVTGWDADTATFIQLFNISILYAPSWFLDAARDIDDDILALETTMLSLGYEANARSVGEEAIYYAEDIPFYDDARLNVTAHSRDVRRLEAACPPDDYTGMPLDGLDHYFTISAFEPDAEPIAGAGYDVFSATVGQLTILVAHAQRTKGYGTFMLARAAEECMFDGLIPQWVVPVGNEVTEKMANDVGFLLSGYRTSITFA